MNLINSNNIDIAKDILHLKETIETIRKRDLVMLMSPPLSAPKELTVEEIIEFVFGTENKEGVNNEN